MIDNAHPYENLIDTGLPWVPSAPAHWHLTPNKAFLKPRKVLVGSRHSEFELLSLTKRGVIVRDLSTGKGKFSADMGTSQEVRPGDIVFCLFDVPETPRTVGLSAHHGMITGAYTVMEVEDSLVGQFLELFYLSMDDRKLLSPLYSGLRNTVPKNRLLGAKTPIPPPDEQAAIVKFLGHANRKIGRYIQARRKLIKLLEEQKQVIIHRAVTRGLDPNVRMKPSGVEWLGDVPEHWEVVPFHAVARQKVIRNCSDRELLSVYLHRGVIRFSDIAKKRTNATSQDLSKYQAVDPGDLVLNNQQAWRGSVGVSEHVGIVSPAYLIFELTAGMNRGFANYLFRSPAMVRQFVVASRGVGSIQRNVYWPELRVTRVPIPPPSEQKAILLHLRSGTEKLDNLISDFNGEVGLMEEYRTRLTADVVTGKLDVRDAAAKLPDLTPEDELAEADLGVDDEAFEEDDA